MKRLALGLIISAALAGGPTLSGCGDDNCTQQCDKLVQCWKDLSGGQLEKSKAEKKRFRKQCLRQCKKNKSKLKKDIRKICG